MSARVTLSPCKQALNLPNFTKQTFKLVAIVLVINVVNGGFSEKDLRLAHVIVR